MKEIPALYEVAKQITHDAGLDYYDPRDGKLYPAPKPRKPKKRVKRNLRGARARVSR